MSDTTQLAASPTLSRELAARAPSLSVVIPLYNEEESLPSLAGALRDALADYPGPFEVIFVDDGSRDRSFALLQEICRQEPRFKAVRLRRNSGQTAAMAAGFGQARGEVIVPLDADLQNDPGDIPVVVAKLEEGYDVVSGWRKNRQDKALTRRIPSLLANRLISRITGVGLHDYGCTLKAYRAEIVKQVHLYGEMHRFIPAYAALQGAAVTEIPVRHHPRRAGKSKYGLSRTLKVVLDLLLLKFLGTFGTRPIHFFGTTAALLWLGAIVLVGMTAYDRLVKDVFVHRNPLFLIAIFFALAGLQLVMMGLLAEIGIRTYHEAAGRTPYAVRDRLNCAEEDPPSLTEPG